MLTLEVEVKESHIKNGRKASCQTCPIALAVKEARPDFTGVYMGANFLYCESKDFYYAYTSEEAVNFVNNFDLGVTVNPQTLIFVLRTMTTRTQENYF
jgi:hypothetical protein